LGAYAIELLAFNNIYTITFEVKRSSSIAILPSSTIAHFIDRAVAILVIDRQNRLEAYRLISIFYRLNANNKYF
jgi:hypothetical protein